MSTAILVIVGLAVALALYKWLTRASRGCGCCCPENRSDSEYECPLAHKPPDENKVEEQNAKK